jgi:hypothetical protein
MHPSRLFLTERLYSRLLLPILRVQSIDKGATETIVFSNLNFAASWNFKVSDELVNLGLAQFWFGSKFYPSGNGFFLSLAESFSDQNTLDDDLSNSDGVMNGVYGPL